MSEFEQIIDSIIVDLNQSVGRLVGGNYVGWMSTQNGVIQKLIELKNALKENEAEKEET